MTGVSSRYRVLRRLGQGGMAEVFEAELVGERGFVRKVAIKQLRPEALRDPMAAQRFIDETRIASRLHHAHIVGVLDVGVLEDRPFQVLELVDGLDADELIRRAGGALPVVPALMIAHAVAHALDHAHTATGPDGHRLGIVHRDVKPPNILVAWTGDVKLADFGIAFAHDRVAHTETGAVAGTRGFIAPEQRARGQLDGRSDVFALGLTLHALCTGKTPLAELAAEVRLLGGEPIELDPALPDDVRALIAHAVRPERLARPSAAAFAAAIGDVLAARQAGDPRSVIRALLAPLRRPPRAAGALDLLLGIELVPVDPAGETPGTVQLYATEVPPMRAKAGAAAGAASPAQAEGTAHVEPIADAGRVAPAKPDDGAAAIAAAVRAAAPAPHAPTAVQLQRAAPRRGGRALMIAGVATIVVVVGAIVLRAPAAPPSAPMEAAAASPDATRRITDAVAAHAITVPDAAGPDTVAAHAATLPDAAAPLDAGTAPAQRPSAVATHVTAPVHHHAPSPAATAPAAATDPAARGYVQVVGEDLLRARVLIDGVAVGYVPNRFAVALGHHRVEVERPDGVRLPPRELEVTSFHTAQRPARPAW